ncbi:MAG: hypothetical protein ABC578_07205 [Candidatus Methanosuratincola petrocarbonis]
MSEIEIKELKEILKVVLEKYIECEQEIKEIKNDIKNIFELIALTSSFSKELEKRYTEESK